MQSNRLPAAVGPYSLGRIVELSEGTYGYTSGQLGLDPKTNELPADLAL